MEATKAQTDVIDFNNNIIPIEYLESTMQTPTSSHAKPFLKWAGGKGQLLCELEKRLPLAEIDSGR